MGTYVEIDGELYVTKEDYLNTVKYYENSLSAERNGAKEEIKELEEENKKLKDDIKKWEDRWMVKLAEIYVMPTRELIATIAKNERFSSWYDTVKKKMLHELGFDRLDVQDLLKENEKLKKELELVRKNTRANVETLDNMYGENVDLKKENEELRIENKNLKSDLEQFSEAYKRYRDFEKEELAESCYDLEKENKKLREENEELREYKSMYEGLC